VRPGAVFEGWLAANKVQAVDFGLKNNSQVLKIFQKTSLVSTI
jgi:hypothetical protein